MLKIAMLCFNVVGRGTYLRALNLAKEFHKLGHALTILATNESGWKIKEEVIEGVHVVTMPDLLSGSLRSGWDPVDTCYRIGWLRTRDFDIVHAFECRPTVIYPALFQENRGSLFFSDWCDWLGKGGSVEERPNPVIRNCLRPVETFYEEHFRSLARGTTVICSTLLEKAGQLGIPESDLLVLPNGLNDRSIHLIDRFEARQALGLPENDYIIGYTGASFPRDIRLMEDAFSRVAHRVPKALLVHIGRTNYAIPQGSRMVTTGGISEHELNLYLAACNLCWLPLSDTNANRGRLPMKLSNYLSAGRPVVATKVGDLVPFFLENPVGLLAGDNPEEISQAVLSLYNDPELSQNLGKKAYQTSIDPRLSWSARASELERFYLRH